MAVPKVCGIETEFGIAARGVDLGPMAASSMLVLAHSGGLAPVGWDFAAERPGSDVRGFDLSDHGAACTEPHLVNTVLANGARFYVDHAHPEYSSPECRDALEVVTWDRAGEEIVRSAMARAASALPEGAELIAYKNNSDGKGNSYGCHENYLLDRGIPFAHVVRGATPHLVSRQVFCGAGKVGSEAGSSVEFQISQRPDFIEEEVGLETTIRRPIVNTRDEPHADPALWRRLHVILGDANMSENATMLKVGTTAIVLAMIEDGVFPDGLELEDPVSSNRTISADPTLTATVRLARGGRISALDLQRRIHAAARSWATRCGLESVGGDDVGTRILDGWESVLDSLGGDQSFAARVVDWVAKRRIIDAHCARHGHHPTSPSARAIDLQYHDLRPDRGLAARAGMLRVADDDAVARAIVSPPPSTRAYLRGSVIGRWPAAILSCNWDGMVIALNGDRTVRIGLDDPLAWSADRAAEMLAGCATPEDLVRSVGAHRPLDR
jgi:proteasome accessory factor PafA2